MTALTWNGWLTCADCSSLGFDKATGQQPFPVSGSCSSCGGPWPRRPQDFVTAARDEVIRTVREWQRAVGEDSMRRIKQESGEDQEPAATLAVMEALEALETLEAAIPKPLSGKSETRPNRLFALATNPSPLPHGALASAEPPRGDLAVSGPAYLHPGGRLAVTNAQGGVDSYRVRIEGPWEEER